MRQTPDKLRELAARLKGKMNLRSLVLTLAVLVVFTTTYLLILPAFTLDKDEAAEQGGIDVVAIETAAEEAKEDAAVETADVKEEVTAETTEEADKTESEDAKEETSEKKAETKSEEKSDVKLLTKKTTINADQAKGDNFAVSAVVGKDAKVPADVTITATELDKTTDGFDYDQYKKDALKALKKDSSDVKAIKNIKFYDISLASESQEKAVEPEAMVNVKIAYEDGMKVDNADNIRIVHFAEQENGTEKPVVLDTAENNVETATNASGSKVTEASFDTDGFSKFAVVEVEKLEATYLTADGKTLKVTATFDSREQLPEGAKLDVSEVSSEEDPETYAKRNERLADALFKEYGNVAITDARYLNISVIVPDGDNTKEWKEYEPVYPVEVKIGYTNPMDTTNPGEYKDYNDGSTKVTPDIGNHIVAVHYTEDGAEILDTDDEKTNAGVSETVTSTDSFSEYDFAYVYEYDVIDTNYDYDPSPISELSLGTKKAAKAAGSGLLRAAEAEPEHSKTLGDNHDGTHKLSLTVTGDADTDSNTASNANVIIVFDTSNSMINYYVPMANGARGSNNADGSGSFVLYRNTRGTEADDGYTGTVYSRTRYGNNWYYSEYTGQRYSKTIRRADAAEKVLYDFTHALYGYQNTDDPSTPDVDESKNIQTALITFNKTAKTTQNWTSTETDITNKVSSTGAGGSRKITNSSGTNWEDALRAAQTMVNSADNDPTFVVFITDGQPTQWHDYTSGYDTSGEGYVQSRDEARAVQLACAATGTDSHGALFGIYAYGTEADYLDELMYYAYTGTARDMDPGTVDTDGYYNASDSTSLTEAINDIFSKIVKTLGITAVSISDGTTSQVQTTSGEISHLLEVDTSSYEYWLSINTVDNKFTMKDLVSGNDVEYTVSTSGNNVTISWTKDGTDYSETYEGTVSAGTARIKWDRATSFYNYAPPTAQFTDPKVDWNLSSVGTLLDGVTYEVTFDVYPSQYTLDLIADLKNGLVKYNSVDENVRKYLLQKDNDYILATNTSATLTYTDSRNTNGQQNSDYVNPDPVSTSAAQAVSITKDWSNDVDDRVKPTELMMHVTRDGTDRYELNLTHPTWQDDAYISFGIVTVHNGVITVKTPGHDYSFSEPPKMEYYWELVAPTLRPMKINGEDTMLVKVDENDAPSMSGDNATAVGADGYTYYKLTINGTAMYYKVDNSIASLHAENHRRSYLQILKTVQNPKAGDTFEFTTTVVNSNAASGKESDIDSDYYVWFSVYDTKGNKTVISDDLATGEGLQRETNAETGAYTGYYYIPSGKAVSIKMQDGYSLRFLNLPIGSTYSVSESLDGNYENVSITGARKYKEKQEGADGSSSAVDKSEPAGTVDGLGISGTIEYSDSRYEIEYTNERVVTEASAKKEWKNADGTTTAPQGGQVTYTLYADGEPTDYKVVLDGTPDEEPTGIGGYESEGWTATFVNLSKYKVVNGEKVEIEYKIAETTPYPGYTPSTTEPVENGGKIINTQEKTTVNALKAWENADGTTTAPEGGQVTYTLYADGTPTSYTVTLDGKADTAPTGTGGYESEAWKAEFMNLPKYKVVSGAAVEIAYTIAETITYPGYTASTTEPVNSGDTITNKQGSTEIFAEKVWKNANGSTTAPENATVVFTLYADGVETNHKVTLDGEPDTKPSRTGGYESEAWKASFVNLPKYKAGTTNEIVYTIAETTTYPGYTASTTDPVGSGSTITNSQDPTSVYALKAWVNADGTTKAPQGGQVTYTLYADGTATNYTVTLDGTVDTAPEVTGGYESEAWKAEFVKLPKYQTGTTTEIVYTIAETATYPGYTASTTDPVASGETITNTQEETDANALKAWVNADGSTTPPEGATVEFKLYADDAETPYTVTLDGTPDTAPEVTGGYESEAWKAEFVNLPKYRTGTTTEIEYTIAETTGYPGYTADKTDPVASDETITNTQDTVDVNATKAWKNADGSITAPTGASVDFTLYTDGEPTDNTVTLDGNVDENGEAAEWVASFNNLPKFRIVDGKAVEIGYTVGETKTWPGYDLVTTTPVDSGGTITNQQQTLWVRFKKTDMDTKALQGAVFTFNDGKSETDIVVTSGVDGIMATAETASASSVDEFEFGVRTAPYVLNETIAPSGYLKLEDEVNVYVSTDGVRAMQGKTKALDVSGSGSKVDPYVVTVINTDGTKLPMTGGIGTTIFYILGSLLVIGCGIVLVSRRRIGANK